MQDRPWNGIVSWKRPDQRPSIVKFFAIPLSDGEENYILDIHHDITNYIQSQNKLKQMHNWLFKVCQP